jgi:hypothetical protein
VGLIAIAGFVHYTQSAQLAESDVRNHPEEDAPLLPSNIEAVEAMPERRNGM